MRINRQKLNLRDVALHSVLGATLLVGASLPATAFDVRSSFAPDTPSLDIFKFGLDAYKNGRSEEAVEALRFASEKGHPGSSWKLAQMYMDGDRVERDHKEAFRLFADIANRNADARRGTKTARYVALSFVALAKFYETGSEAAGVGQNRRQARRYYEHAAFFFDDADAQYELARFYLEADKVTRNQRRQANRSLFYSAQKGHPKAAAKLGLMLVEGDHLKRDVVQGLKFLTIALRHADEEQRLEIQPLQERAYSLASEDERRQAIALAQASSN
jgi:hypothetical protein